MSLGGLNFRHLYYFWRVAKEENLTRASENLHVSQSAVSSQIRQLENALGNPLFVREGRALRLSEFGSVVLDYAEGIFNLGSELLETVRAGEGRPADILRVGAVATLSRNFQQNLLRSVIGDEELRLVLESAGLEELLARLQVHNLDMILSNRPVVADIPGSLRCRRIARQSVCVVGPKPRRRFRFPDDLVDVALLLPGPSSDIRSQFDLLCEEVGLESRVSAEVDDMAMLRLLARDSGSVAILPEVVVQDELANGTLHRYCELPGVYENFFAITARRQFQSSTLRLILEGI